MAIVRKHARKNENPTNGSRKWEAIQMEETMT